jgi:hypothetical protein
MMSIPFPFFSKRWEWEGWWDSRRSAAKDGGGRRVDFPRSFSSETDPAGLGNKRRAPRRELKISGGVWTGRISRIRILASALGPA